MDNPALIAAWAGLFTAFGTMVVGIIAAIAAFKIHKTAANVEKIEIATNSTKDEQTGAIQSAIPEAPAILAPKPQILGGGKPP